MVNDVSYAGAGYDRHDARGAGRRVRPLAAYAYRGARVLLDRLDGRIADLVHGQARLTPTESDAWVRDQLDGYINFIYRRPRTGATDTTTWRGWRRPRRHPGSCGRCSHSTDA
jgi:hypothetical protein